MMIQYLVPLAPTVRICNLSHTPYARYGEAVFSKRIENLSLKTKLKGIPEVILTKYDNLPNSAYRNPMAFFESIRVVRLVRQNPDGTKTAWKSDGSALTNMTQEQVKRIPPSPARTTLVLIEAENFQPSNSLVIGSPWRWNFAMLGNGSIQISHNGPDYFWVRAPSDARDGFTIPIWLTLSTQSNQTVSFFGYIDGLPANPYTQQLVQKLAAPKSTLPASPLHKARFNAADGKLLTAS